MKTEVYQDAKGVYRWKSNDQVPPFEAHEYGARGFFEMPGFDYKKQREAREADTTTFLAEYRERMKNYVPSGEEMFEMRAAFGPGEEVVNVITGQRFRT
jgi:hypothetical protein